LGLAEQFQIFVNPISGRGRAAHLAERLESLAQGAGYDPQRVDMLEAGDGTRLARTLAGRDADLVVVGGDGTFNEVLNGADLARHRLAFLPAGTVNVVAKEFGMAGSPARWLRQMRDAGEGRFDVPAANGRRFFVVLGAGLDGRVIHEIAAGRKPNFRFSDYFLPVARACLDAHRRRVRIEADGFDPDRPWQFVIVGNCASYGGPCRFTGLARPDDGLLDVCAMALPDLPALALTGLASVLGCAHALGTVQYGRVRRITLRGNDEYYEFDGEAGGRLPVQITLEPRPLRLLVPRP
jgi:diacylglycerol kinase family enzyme